MNIIIPLNTASQNDNVELRYALRGVQAKYGQANITIVGDLPDWLVNVTYIPFSDHRSAMFKDRNIAAKILAAIGYRINPVGQTVWHEDYKDRRGRSGALVMCEVYRDEGDWLMCMDCERSNGRVIIPLSLRPITGNFLFMNDDHYIMPGFDENVWYYAETIPQAMARLHVTNSYRKVVGNTQASLRMRRLPEIMYDCHAPMLMNAELFAAAMQGVSWDRPGGYLVKSLYGNYCQGEVVQRRCATIDAARHDLPDDHPITRTLNCIAEHYADMKIGDVIPDVSQRKWFSISDYSFPGILNVLHGLWPEKSVWEI